VFDAGLEGAASHAAAGLFKEDWARRRKMRPHYLYALPILERLYELRQVSLTRDDGSCESLLCISPAAILEPDPIRRRVASLGDGWLEADGQRHEGWVYVAAGVWCGSFLPSLNVHGRAGSAYLFPGERAGRIRQMADGRQSFAFVRDAGTTYFGDGTAEREHTAEHDRRTLERAAEMGLTEPVARLWGNRPYAPDGLVYEKIAGRTWLATGGRKMGVILGASCARRLVDEELSGCR
jgi:hypothetical protein